MSEQEEKKNRRVGMVVSITVHTLILLLFAFLMAWREPNPPLPEYGIELNFGLDDAGTGDTQPLTPVTPTENLEEAQSEESPQEETVDEIIEEAQPEETSEKEETKVFEDVQSQDVVEEEVKEAQEEKPVEEPEEAEEDKIDMPQTVEPQEDATDAETQQDDGESEEAAAVNQGDKTDEVGDQGNPEGDIDARALYGKPGGGGGSYLKLAGWTWDVKPEKKDTSEEEGFIEFKIEIDDQGEIISINRIEGTLSPSVERFYKTEVEKLTFSKIDNEPPAPRSTGKIKFIIKSN